jgi:hypothetical protein
MRFVDKIPGIIRRVLILAVLAAIIGFVAIGFVAKASTPDNPPTVKEAPWAVQTTTRIFYAKELRTVGDTPEIRKYWIFDGKHYTFQEGLLVLDRFSWGSVTVIKRKS